MSDGRRRRPQRLRVIAAGERQLPVFMKAQAVRDKPVDALSGRGVAKLWRSDGPADGPVTLRGRLDATA